MIYHITTFSDWESQKMASTFRPPAYAEDGFIHCCTEDQLQGVIERYYANRNDLLLLYIDESILNVPVKNEKSTGDELFPHVFGPINKEAIIKVEPY